MSENSVFNTNITANLKTRNIDKYLYVVENEKTSKGINIFSGYNLIKISNGLIVSEKCFVAEKDNFTAHGVTVKQAISDLQFKIVSEKLKNEPIEEDTLLTVNYYRLITGACDLGVRDFMKQNGLEFEIVNEKTKEINPIKAKDLLPLLERNNAYGIEKFKSLLSWEN